jgi:Arm DNA-binding domain
MAGKLHKLSARTVAALARPGRHSDGGGLYLFISRDSKALRRRWVFRFARAGKVREMGLGSANGVSLAEARKLAAAARSEMAKGQDPIGARDASLRARQGRKTFGECAVTLITAKQSEWRNAKHRRQWRSTLETYCAPIWAMPVQDRPDRGCARRCPGPGIAARREPGQVARAPR